MRYWDSEVGVIKNANDDGAQALPKVQDLRFVTIQALCAFELAITLGVKSASSILA